MEEKELKKLYKDNPPRTVVSEIGSIVPNLELFLEAEREGCLAGTWGEKMYLSKIKGAFETIYSIYWNENSNNQNKNMQS